MALGGLQVIDVVQARRETPTVHQWSPEDGKTPLRISRRTTVVGETVTFSGQLDTTVSRAIVLEAGYPDWTTVATGRTDASGAFSIRSDAPAVTTTYRVRAPRFTTDNDGETVIYSGQITTKKTLEPVAQESKVASAPAPVGQTEDGTSGLVPISATFKPARADRRVALERQSKDLWNTVATSSQDEDGSVMFNVEPPPDGSLARYRVVAQSYEDVPPEVSDVVRVTPTAAVWEDDFAGTALDTSVWEYRHAGIRSEDSGRRCAESSPEAVSVSRGRAHLLTQQVVPPRDPENCPHGEYLNGHISTRPSFSFTFGVLAARIKFPHQQGQHGALWSQPSAPADVTGNPALSGAEIDVVEYFGDEFRNGVLQHSIYWKGTGGKPQKVGGAKDRSHLLKPGQSWSNSFHVYSVEWTRDEYIFRVDGHETLRTSRGISKTPQYVIISLLTSDWELGKLDPEKLNAMQIDWVRVWQP